MIAQRIERNFTRLVEQLRNYEKYNWRKFWIASGCACVVNLTLAYFPIAVGVNERLSLVGAGLLVTALYLGALPTLLSTGIVTIGQLLLPSLGSNLWIDCASALLAGALLKVRVHPPVAMLAFGAVNLALSLSTGQDSSAANLSLKDFSLASWGVRIADIFVNFSLAAALWTLLPRRSYITRQHRRGSLAVQIFAWSTLIALLPAVLTVKLWVIDPTAIDVRSYALPLWVATAVALSSWLTSRVAASTRIDVAAMFFDGPSAARRKPSRAWFKDTPPEIAKTALRWRRQLQRWHRAATGKEGELNELRTELEVRRRETSDLTARLQEKTKTLLQVQQRDTTNLKDLGEALREANATIEQIRRGRNLFVAMMSHEVRTPLHGLMATLSLLREETLSEEGRHRLGIARNSARSLLTIANDILDLSRIETGGFSFEVAPFDPRRLIGLIVEEFQATAQGQHLKLISTVADDLPVTLLGDRNRIHQVISNLVTNGLKFTEKGGVTIRVAWREAKLIVDVIDTGAGVPAEKRDIIFDSFVQADSAPNRRFAGTGLGLTIGRHLAKAMGGSLQLHATGKHGSIFRLELKLEPSDEPAPEDTSQRILAHPTGHILVVEDNDANQYVARVLLESLDCTVVIVDTGVKALERVQQEQFDIVLMDCQLPGMDGFETAQRMRQVMTKRIPIIAMTANALPEDKAKCTAAGMDDFLTKPFNKATLSKLLGEWLADDAAEKSEPVLDTAVFDELWESLQWRTKPLEGIYEAVVNNVRGAIKLLSQPQPVATPQLLRSLHTVRGSASMVGAKRIARIAAMLEHSAKNQQLSKETVETASLAQELRELESAVTQKLAPYTGGRQS